MSWQVTLLGVHLAVLAMLIVLFWHSPNSVQQLVIGILASATVVLVYHYAAEVFEWPTAWELKAFAYHVEHIGVLLYVLRLFISDQERRCLPKLSTHSPHSPR